MLVINAVPSCCLPSAAANTTLKYYDLVPGKGDPIVPGATVTVHYDCIFRGLYVVSSRSARLLGGNRTIAEPFTFVVGQPVSGVAVKKIDDGANAMFAGTGGPKPPPALSTAVIGMKPGGKVSVEYRKLCCCGSVYV
jgi:peptidylprolyl isomerase